MDLLLTAKRDAAAAKRFFRKGAHLSRQYRATGDQRGQEPGIPSRGRGAESGRRISSTKVSKRRSIFIECPLSSEPFRFELLDRHALANAERRAEDSGIDLPSGGQG